MRTLRTIASSALGLSLTLVLLYGIANAGDIDRGKARQTRPVSSAASAGAAGLTRESDLTPDGSVYEINDDGRGNLWISEFDADQIRQFNMSTQVYTIYQGTLGADDARRDSGNTVWWTDYDNGRLGKIDLSAGSVTTWTLPGATNPWGIAFDAAEQVWITDANEPNIYRFNLTTTQVCTYTVPDDGVSDYIVHDAGKFWIGDSANDRMVVLDPATNKITYYQLPFDSYPEGLAMGDGGDVWWADSDNPFIGQLKPNSLEVATYTLPYSLPVDEGPSMIDFSGGSIWYSEYSSGTFGLMNPALATKVSSIVTSTSVVATPICAILGPGITASATTTSGVAAFTNAVYKPTINSGGWTVYQLASGSGLWPIRHVGGSVWIGDQDRDKLVWFSHRIYTPLVVKE